MNQKDLGHAIRYQLSETNWLLLPRKEKKTMIKRFWLWFKERDWRVGVAIAVYTVLVRYFTSEPPWIHMVILFVILMGALWILKKTKKP